jgi:hypothetical protein
LSRFVPAIHVWLCPDEEKKDVDARDKRGHDQSELDAAGISDIRSIQTGAGIVDCIACGSQ